jgi:hypothetical protein
LMAVLGSMIGLLCLLLSERGDRTPVKDMA